MDRIEGKPLFWWRSCMVPAFLMHWMSCMWIPYHLSILGTALPLSSLVSAYLLDIKPRVPSLACPLLRTPVSVTVALTSCHCWLPLVCLTRSHGWNVYCMWVFFSKHSLYQSGCLYSAFLHKRVNSREPYKLGAYILIALTNQIAMIPYSYHLELNCIFVS